MLQFLNLLDVTIYEMATKIYNIATTFYNMTAN